MEYLFFLESNNFRKSSTVCCELVLRVKHYLNTLQAESQRVRGLQLECNELLDKFYPLKRDFEILVEEVLPIKYLGDSDNRLNQEHLKEFSLFVNSVWLMGKHAIIETGKKNLYVSFVGEPLSEMMSTIRSFVDELTAHLNYIPYHSHCTSSIRSFCAQIDVELQNNSLLTADSCLRQYIYLVSAIPFLKELQSLINQYLMTPDVYSPKEFLNRTVMRLPSVERFKFQADTDDTAPFRFVVDLLTGKLLASDVLDHNSDIRPVVEEDFTMQLNKVVEDTVQWVRSQYKCDLVPKSFKNFVAPLPIERRRSFGYPMHTRPKSSHQSHDENYGFKESLGLISADNNSGQRISRKGRKPKSVPSDLNPASDLLPINLHTLKSPILQPLI